MAGVLLWAPSGEVTLVAATAKTVLELSAAAQHRFKVLSVEVFFKGIVATDTPVKIEVRRMTTTGTGTALTLLKNSTTDVETIQTTGKFNDSVEPTLGSLIKTLEIHPQTGAVIPSPMGQEMVVKGGESICYTVTAAQGQTISLNVLIEE